MAGDVLYAQPDRARFPYQQLLVLGICRICEPIAFMSIFPYIYYMIESFHVTTDSTRVAFYAGLVTSVFAGAECLGAGFWGNLSDRYGRKPILLTGLAGTGVSMLIFGFAPNLPVALLARAIGGALNGNIGVLQTTVNEVVKVEAHQARAFAIMPSVWCLGAIVGSVLGGSLADPVRNYPGWFQAGSIFDKFPYLLTNLVCTGVVLMSMLVGILFLEETHEEKKGRRDVGLEIGDWIRGKCGQPSRARVEEHEFLVEDEDLHSLDDTPPEYSSTVSSPSLSPTVTISPPPYRSVENTPRTSLHTAEPAIEAQLELTEPLVNRPLPASVRVKRAFSRPVVLNITGFGILAYHTISAEQLLPVLLSLPETDETPSLPFKFAGGFGLSTRAIGGILSTQGIIQMVATIVVFPMVHRRIGSLATYRCAVLLYPLLYLVVPYVSLLPAHLKMPAVYALLLWKVTSQAFAFPSSSIMLANAAPSSKVLGTLNGAAASAASASRAFGPTISGLLQSAGLSCGTVGLPWWVNVLVAAAGACISLLMVEDKRHVPNAGDDATSLNADLEAAPSADQYLPDVIAAESTNASCDNLLSTPTSPLLPRPSHEMQLHDQAEPFSALLLKLSKDRCHRTNRDSKA